ncbi:MAG: AmmeMemoRadiSam system radical SAM enzyme [Bacteroidota bacterium]
MKQNGNKISRRNFIGQGSLWCLGCYMFGNFFSAKKVSGNQTAKSVDLHKADYWTSLPENKVKCQLCPNCCEVLPGENGKCHSRGNREGVYYSLVYSYPAIIALDNIEKSPLFHYQVKGQAFSIATTGCNLQCQFCQNWEYSQADFDATKTFYLEPAEVISRAKKNGVDSINFFYTEPTIYFEYMRDIATLAKKENMTTFCITNGYINEAPLNELIPLIDAFAVGLKSFDNSFYSTYLGGELEPVKKSLLLLAKNKDKTWFEIVNLLVTGLNDDMAKISEMCQWIKDNIGTDVPLHFTRFEPYYLLKNLEPTPVSTLSSASITAKNAGLEYVYVGNLPGDEGCNTLCPECGKTLFERVNFETIKNNSDKGKCSCGHQLPGHWL